jgi:abhydrolase domain-containing protein 6
MLRDSNICRSSKRTVATPLVLIHGLGSSAETWAALMLLLSKEYLVYAPDLPGFGRTLLAPEGTNIKTHVLYLERFLDVLGYHRVTLVGNSLGGWIATRFAVEYPERVERVRQQYPTLSFSSLV